MRRYDDPVEVRKGGDLPGAGGAGDEGGEGEGPDQFLWRGRLWKVRAVLAHWVETGPWWQSPGVSAVVGTDDPVGSGAETEVAGSPVVDLIAEREMWRVEAGRGVADPGGVFDLSFSWSDGRWLLVGCVD